MEDNKKEEEKGKTGNIPNEEIKGSDADKAYDENGISASPDSKKPIRRKVKVPKEVMQMLKVVRPFH